MACKQFDVVVGNPPYGKNANLAVEFVNRAAGLSHLIVFVLPRTFRKASVVNRLNPNLHLESDTTVPEEFFPGSIITCYQEWRVDYSRVRERVNPRRLSEVREWFELVGPEESDFAIQRVGGRAGLIRTGPERVAYSDQSHYFIRQHDPRVLAVFQTVDFDRVKFNTVGNPSISPGELVELFVAAAPAQGISIV